MVELSPVSIRSGAPPARIPRPVTRFDLEAALEFERSIAVTSLRQRVHDEILSAANAQWFAFVGTPLKATSALQGTLEQAQKPQLLLEEASLEYRNVLSAILCCNFPYHFNRCWNEVVNLLKPVLDELLTEKLVDSQVPVSDYLRCSICATIR